ncbi:MAG TPA: S9 family peptidase [Thermomicrobiales bacterium]
MPRPLEPDDILRLQSVSDPQTSPDGTRVVYTVGTLDDERDRSDSSLWVVPTAGGEPRQLTRGTGRDGNPRWSPDGAWIAFTSDRDGDAPQLWLLPLAGGDPRQLTDLHHGAGTPIWSPDGARIAFSARVTPDDPPKNAPRVARRLRTFLNGSGYIGDGFWHLFVVDVPSGSTRQITDGEWHHFTPAWSPDGTRLAFVTTRREDWDLEWVWDIYTSDADGGDLRQLTQSAGVAQGPAWSPDGTTIGYYDNQNIRTGSTEDYHLYVIPASGGAATNLTGHMDRGVSTWEPPAPTIPPIWSPDSQSALALLNVAGNVHCYRISMDGEATRVIGGTGSTGWPTISADGARLAFAWTGPEMPPEIWSCDGSGDGRRQLTRTNAALMAEIAVSTPERFAITADGHAVESILWLPPGKRAADGPFPTLLHLHGGPHGAVGEAFSTQQQMLATHGFAVYSINFRGSAGYGKEFADTILADWGAKEHADSMAALDTLIAQGIADPDRLGVFGGSYGGYMTNEVITHTDRFHAAVTMATISDLATLSGTTDQWESIDFDSGGAPWEAEAYYRVHSAMPRVARITTPLLIMHGEEDQTCRITEAEQLFAALRKLRREVEFVRYPGESHGFTRGRPRTQRDALTRLLGWFTDHLMA